MRRAFLSAVLIALVAVPCVWSYVEAPLPLGHVIQESTNILVVEVARVNKDKNLIIFKKVQDLKGKHPTEEIKHNIGQRGFHPRESKFIMAWAEEGKKAVIFHNGGASETCLGDYWYQCYPEGEWWGLSHAEPFLLRTYCGNTEKLGTAVTSILQGQEVVVPCMVDANKEKLHERKGKLQRLKASLKKQDYNAKRDFVAVGGDGEEIQEYQSVTLLGEGSPDWKFLPASQLRPNGDQWRVFTFNDQSWRTGKAPIGYGEEEIERRQGTVIPEQGTSFLFRHAVNVPAELYRTKGVTFRIAVASDDNAGVFLNGQLIDQDPEDDHEFAYWNREIELESKQLRVGKNVLAVLVKNHQGSSDLYFDMEVTASLPVPKNGKK